ncbi:aminotransferase class I/II-fold pyridoxal phosphate-dependent enzyme [Oscillospiraceae bacterium OttesenSCG-928-G22]|nr:aminotransferase class I/II-fold pyridoxal phosphate-dependent enzyme [Oscillospiraceae bacterium OttesenSCG-928-G22]
MRIREFLLEVWLNPRAPAAKYNLGSSCMKPLEVDELFKLIGQDTNVFLEEVRNMDLHYGHFFGMPRLLDALSKLYKNVTPDMILSVHGGTGANNMVVTEFIEPGDNVVAIYPNYQQHYSTPEWLGAEVRYLELNEKDGYLPDIERLKSLVDKNTKMITLSNPNNPTGAFIGADMLKDIADIARKFGTYVLSDEIYRGLGEDAYMPSMADLYERALVTSSTSKVFSMAGTRVGWIVAPEKEAHDRLMNRRSYDTICNGVFDELITAIAIENAERIFDRNRKIMNTNRAILEDWMKTQPRLTSDYKSEAPIRFFKYDYNISATEFGDTLFDDYGVCVCQGDVFEIPKSFRLGYGYVEEGTFKEGLRILGDYMKTLD